MIARRCILIGVALLVGCGGRKVPAAGDMAAGDVAAVRMAAAHSVAGVPARRVSTLLNFEAADDLTFVAAGLARSAVINSRFAREGSRSLYISPATAAIAINLPSLLQGRAFPADWTLVGGYFYSDAPAYITVGYDVPGRAAITRTVAIGAGAWTPVMLD